MNIPVYNIKNEEDYKKLKKEVLIWKKHTCIIKIVC
jgi:hypothetical protein